MPLNSGPAESIRHKEGTELTVADDIPDYPKSARLNDSNEIEIDGKIITREKLEAMKQSEKRIKTLSFVLDTLGLEAFISLITGIGDVGGMVLSAYPVLEAIRHGLPKSVIAKMSLNLIVDLGIGAVPIVGDIVDFFYKANKKNHKLFAKHIEEIEKKFPPHEITEAQMKGLAAHDRVKVESVLGNKV